MCVCVCVVRACLCLCGLGFCLLLCLSVGECVHSCLMCVCARACVCCVCVCVRSLAVRARLCGCVSVCSVRWRACVRTRVLECVSACVGVRVPVCLPPPAPSTSRERQDPSSKFQVPNSKFPGPHRSVSPGASSTLDSLPFSLLPHGQNGVPPASQGGIFNGGLDGPAGWR